MAAPAISIDQVGYSVGTKVILSDVSGQISPGTFTVVIGENGAGKTTLLKLLMGFSKPTHGRLQVLGREPHTDPFSDREGIAYLAERLSPPVDWSVEEYLRFHRFFYPRYSMEKEKKLLAHLGIQKNARIGQLSTGERRRVQIVGGLSTMPSLLIVDEITAVLDIVGRKRFLEQMQEIMSQGGTVIMATNIIDDVDSYASHLLLLHNGKLLHHLSRQEFLAQSSSPSMALGIATTIERAMESQP